MGNADEMVWNDKRKRINKWSRGDGEDKFEIKSKCQSSVEPSSPTTKAA
jgi:hypothetical protein